MSKNLICDSGFRAVCQSKEIWSPSSGCSSVRGTHPITLSSSADFFDPRCFADPHFSNSQKWLLWNIKLFNLTFDHLLIAFATCFFAGVVSCARQNDLSDEALRVWPFYSGIQTPALITTLQWHSVWCWLSKAASSQLTPACLQSLIALLSGCLCTPKIPRLWILRRPGWNHQSMVLPWTSLWWHHE